jgi:hypothetical protein
MNAPSSAQELTAADSLLGELIAQPPAARAPTMGNLQRVRYTHADMIDYIIQNPWVSQNELAARYGYSPGWVSNIMASDAFQAAMAARKDEIIDPVMKATVEERFKALVHRSLTVLMEKLEKPNVSDNVAIRAAELGAKAMGLGGHAPAAPQQPAADRLVILAERLVTLQTTVRGGIYDGKAERVEGPVSQTYAEVGGGLSSREGGRAESDAGESDEAAVRADRGQSGQAAV